MNDSTHCSQPASIRRRFGAMLYDAFLLFGVLFAATMPFILLSQSGYQAPINNEQVVHELGTPVQGPLYQLYLLLVIIVFFCWFWLKNRQTLGMQAWRLHIESIDENEKDISLRQCILRLLGALLSFACLGAGYWWIWFDKEHLSWHDRLSGTRIVYTPKK